MDEAALIDLLRRRLPGALAIYMFGSQATGGAGPESDLDLAVLVDGRVDPVALWEIAGELADIATCYVDLVDLRSASTVMQYQIITTGRRLWNRDVRAGVYEAFIMSEKINLDAARAGLMDDIERRGSVHGG